MKKTLTLFALLLMAMVYGQAPNISYASPQSYPLGTAITPLTPNNTGGAVVSSATVSTLAGKTPGQDGTGTEAVFYNPLGVAVDVAGNVYVADTSNSKIRKITPEGVVTTLAGSGVSGDADGIGTSASFSGALAVAVDAAGNCYVADGYKIRKITPAGMVSTLAGSGTYGSSDGIGSAASFSSLRGIAVDATGQIYVPDLNNHKIRKISPSGVVSTLAGSGAKGATDATGTAASFNCPNGVAVDAVGNVYVAEFCNHKIRKITPTGVVSTLAGSGAQGATDGNGSNASFNRPWGIAVDAMGNCYVTDFSSRKIRKISAAGAVTTLAGSGGSSYESIDGIGANANFYQPTGIAVDANGNVYVAEDVNNKIRKISPAGVVSTLAGSGIEGSIDATGTAASFSYPTGVAVDAKSNLYVADCNNHKIRKITAAGVVTTLAGSGSIGAIDGTGIAASFNYPQGITVDAAGNCYIANASNHKIRKITPEGVVTTLAGSDLSGDVDGSGADARFNSPEGVAVDAMGQVYVADTGNHKIRKITPTGVVSTLAGSGAQGATDGAGTNASFLFPIAIAIDSKGNVYVADTYNHKIRKITSLGVVTTLAGTGTQGANDGTGNVANFNEPRGITVDAAGNVYVSDRINNKIRKITPEGVVTTLAGSGTYGAIDGPGTAASFKSPTGVAVDDKQNLYIADTGNHKIRKININGFRINPSLPAGLSFDENTGVISGTPTVASPLTTYTVTATNESGSTTTTLVISTAVLGNESFTKESLSLFPNPAHNLLQIQTSDNLTIDRVIITDLNGKVILEQALDTNTINIAQLASGMYLIKAFSGQQAFTSKFMKAL